MTRRQAHRGRTGRKQSSGVEWLGGIFSLPGYVTGEGEPFRPEVLFWMGADGKILGSTLAKPGEVLTMASQNLRSTMARPAAGRPHPPTRVRVASAELAAALRAGHPGLNVVCAPTPELDEVIALMCEKLSEDVSKQSYLWPGVEPDAVASLFEAMAVLFRVKPWELVPTDQSLFSVTLQELGLRDAALSVIGQAGQSHGLLLFSGISDFDDYLSVAEAAELGEQLAPPPHFSMNFERGADLDPELRKEIANHRWEVAAANAYPWLVAVDEDLTARMPTARELTIAEAIARALTRLLFEKKALRAAWDGGKPVCRTFSVQTHQGTVEVTLHAPYPEACFDLEISDDILGDLAALTPLADEFSSDARQILEDELVHRFEVSPEGKGRDDIQACRLVMDLGAHYLGVTLPAISAADLRKILFELIPRHVSIPASEARYIVQGIRAFYEFLEREYDLEQADSCLRALGGSAVRKLETALVDSGKFGVVKALFMRGGAREGAPRASSKEAAKAKKSKRKPASKPRKR